MAATRHCWKCGAEYKLAGSPGRLEACEKCGSDLKVCLNCLNYDPRVAHQCRDRRAEPVAEKHLANYCEYFELVRREFTATEDSFGTSRENKARDTLKKTSRGLRGCEKSGRLASETRATAMCSSRSGF